MTLGEQLKRYRKERQLTQKQLADQLFVSDKTISKWEMEKGYPDVQTLPQIAALLNTTVDDLLSERSTPHYYEYKSPQQIYGRPLLHIVLPTFHKQILYGNLFVNRKKLFGTIPEAQGVVAIGLKAKGLLSIGLLARGLISLGLLSLGLLSFGVGAIGVIALGDISIGLFALGNISFGLFVIANIALGAFTSGNLTAGWTAIGNESFGPNSYTFADYQGAVLTLHQEMSQPFAATFYNLTLWLNTHPLFIAGFILSSIAGLILAFLIIFLKRNKLFFD
ncbi:helix-turn-helix domain-containing protein [Enterococcus sp. 2201sp1_2201st1_B8_2201SCRN_220225]|uniref:helix-turn-helix domain-containing protein n=1 Tax=unclassified Enterococcus TaxID=2608891 RepID=UPI0034A52E30